MIRITRRTNTGSMLIIVILTVAFILLPMLMILSDTGLYVVDKTRLQSAVEAASLLAASDLSRVVLNDPNFGFVSLSSYPPLGRATCAEDGEPLPVTGINTLVGTIRQNTIVARELGNDTMYSLAGADRSNLENTIKAINEELKRCLSDDSKSVDFQGVKVEPAKDVATFLRATIPGNVELVSVRMSNGWLSGGGSTTIAVPQPEKLAQVKAGQVRNGSYNAFTNIPVGERSFTFAGLGNASSLVSSSQFHSMDDSHICSIVKLECSFVLKNSANPLAALNPLSRLQSMACSQPFSMPDSGPAGVMTVRFSGEPVRGLQSWNDFLNGNFRDSQVITYDVVGGDYPLDKDARMLQTQAEKPLGTNQQFAEHLYDWLRNGHLRPRIDAVLSMINDSFYPGQQEIYAYEFARNGTISRKAVERDPFPVGVSSDAQTQTVSDTSIQSGFSPIIVFRNNVRHIGTASGGKHAGQPIAGSPLNWCELPAYGGDEHAALALGKGKLATRLTLFDPTADVPVTLVSNDQNGNLFRTISGKTLTLQPRRSFYSGGLALDIEIGGTRASTASLDVASMRALRFSRRI